MRKDLITLGFLLLLTGCDYWGRRPASESGPISALRTISSAEECYNNRYETYGTLEDIARKNLNDSILNGATIPSRSKAGYYYIVTLSEKKDKWTCIARPTIWGQTGEHNCKIDQTGVIYYNETENSSDWQKKLGG